jgi:hypothetical protein
MSEFIDVESCELYQYISKIKINILSIELNVKALIQTMCYDDCDKLLISYAFELAGEDYQMWSNDIWLQEYVMNKYGFIKKEINVI